MTGENPTAKTRLTFAEEVYGYSLVHPPGWQNVKYWVDQIEQGLRSSSPSEIVSSLVSLLGHAEPTKKNSAPLTPELQYVGFDTPKKYQVFLRKALISAIKTLSEESKENGRFTGRYTVVAP